MVPAVEGRWPLLGGSRHGRVSRLLTTSVGRPPWLFGRPGNRRTHFGRNSLSATPKRYDQPLPEPLLGHVPFLVCQGILAAFLARHKGRTLRNGQSPVHFKLSITRPLEPAVKGRYFPDPRR